VSMANFARFIKTSPCLGQTRHYRTSIHVTST
jgi:hypothetical protein